jgi:hypothetical protein
MTMDEVLSRENLNAAYREVKLHRYGFIIPWQDAVG